MAGNKQAKNQKCSYRDTFFGRQRNRAISAIELMITVLCFVFMLCGKTAADMTFAFVLI